MILELGLWVARPDAAMTSRTRRRARAARLGRFVLEARGLEPVQLLPRHPHQRWPIGNNTAWCPQRDSNEALAGAGAVGRGLQPLPTCSLADPPLNGPWPVSTVGGRWDAPDPSRAVIGAT